MRVRPYKTSENKIEGAVISFQDIDEFKRRVTESRTFAETLIQNAREGILILDPSLRITAANPAFCRIFHLSADNVHGQLLPDLADRHWIPPGLRQRLLEDVRKNIRLDEFELKHDFPTLGSRSMRFNARRIEPAQGQQSILLSVEDVTDYKKHQADLQTHSALLELASDAVLVRDLEGVIQLWNRGAERIYGWNKSEALGKKIYELLQTKFPVPAAKLHQQVLERGYWEGELIHTRKDGAQIYVHSRWSLHRDSDQQTILELNTDITERKRYEEQLRKLSGQLLQVQDDERRRIARDLHDSTGQKIVALKMFLAEKKPTARSREEQNQLADEILSEIRTLAHLLHPPLLEEAGLLSATRWLVDGFSSRAGIKVRLDIPDQLDRLPSHVEIALFRVIQEALNNIHRHSGAGEAQVTIQKVKDSLLLKVSDDGHGMKMPVSPSSANRALGVGLLGMRERLSQLGGRLAINSSGNGTSIEAEVPLSNAAAS
jgi:PAS domain S-box-containing protein